MSGPAEWLTAIGTVGAVILPSLENGFAHFSQHRGSKSDLGKVAQTAFV